MNIDKINYKQVSGINNKNEMQENVLIYILGDYVYDLIFFYEICKCSYMYINKFYFF